MTIHEFRRGEPEPQTADEKRERLMRQLDEILLEIDGLLGTRNVTSFVAGRIARLAALRLERLQGPVTT